MLSLLSNLSGFVLVCNYLLSNAVAAASSTESSSFLRGLNPRNGTKSLQRETEQAINNDDSFDCSIYEVDGIAPPGNDVIPQWTCVVEASETSDSKTYTFTNDEDLLEVIRTNFGIGLELDDIAGGTIMTVPFKAVVSGSTIDPRREGIVISREDEVSNGLRQLAQLTGSQRVLIVRVIDSIGRSPLHWKSHLKDDFFQDSNNLKSRLSDCSNNKLNISPALGPGVDHGVINIKINVEVKDMAYQQVGDLANAELSKISGLNFDNKIFIIPNDADFGGSAAFAQVSGNTIWIKDKFASYPIVQVHEYGHLLGARHSGKDDKTYTDDSCYMGNKVPWTDYGAHMCFNAAKTWYFGWYSDQQIAINPAEEPFNDEIVGINDVFEGTAGDEKNVVVKITDNYNDYFLMYNRKKGINREAIGGADKVVITKQNAKNQNSLFIKALGVNQEWTYSNFGAIGNTLVVKNCYTNDSTENGDVAKVLIYIDGVNTQYCGEPPLVDLVVGAKSANGDSNSENNSNGSCQDKNWMDSYGDSCSWYAVDNRCSTFSSNSQGTNGWTATIACCACGGGDDTSVTSAPTVSPSIIRPETCNDVEGWHDSGGAQYNCQWYKANDHNQVCNAYGNMFSFGGMTANTACCICGGGDDTSVPSVPTVSPSITPTETCNDVEGWHDSGGAQYNCQWYARVQQACSLYGNQFMKDGLTANDACCTCSTAD